MLIESQHGAIAHRIQAEDNNAYVRQMNYPELITWAIEYGFSVDELAWIQPAYVPNRLWEQLNGGTNGVVHTLLSTENNDLIVGGTFTQADGESTSNIALWNGYYYAVMGDGLNGTVHTLMMHNSQLYAGGSFTDETGNTANLAMWNGNTWQFENVYGGDIYTLCVFDNQLYAAGDLALGRIARKGTSDWEMAGIGFTGAIYELEVYDGSLMAGGAFTQVGLNDVPYIARQNGTTWEALGGGLNSVVRTMAVSDDILYVGGDFFDAAGNEAFGLTKYEAGSWENLIDVNIMEADSGEGMIHALQPYGNQLFIGGYFNAGVDFLQIGRHIATMYLGDNTIQPLGWADATVEALAVQAGRLFIGGEFEWIFEAENSQNVQHLAFTELAATPARLKVLLEGAYDPTTGMMSTELRNNNLLPTTQPFNRSPWNYAGTETVISMDFMPEDVVDWILVEARHGSDNEVVLDRRAAFLLSDGALSM